MVGRHFAGRPSTHGDLIAACISPSGAAVARFFFTGEDQPPTLVCHIFTREWVTEHDIDLPDDEVQAVVDAVCSGDNARLLDDGTLVFLCPGTALFEIYGVNVEARVKRYDFVEILTEEQRGDPDTDEYYSCGPFDVKGNKDGLAFVIAMMGNGRATAEQGLGEDYMMVTTYVRGSATWTCSSLMRMQQPYGTGTVVTQDICLTFGPNDTVYAAGISRNNIDHCACIFDSTGKVVFERRPYNGDGIIYHEPIKDGRLELLNSGKLYLCDDSNSVIAVHTPTGSLDDDHDISVSGLSVLLNRVLRTWSVSSTLASQRAEIKTAVMCSRRRQIVCPVEMWWHIMSFMIVVLS